MNSRLYVGNLPFSVNDEALREMFAADGRNVVSAQVITEPGSGRSRGFGFVEFASPGEASKAIEVLNGKDIEGRALVVNEARERARSGGAQGRGPKGPRG